MHQQNLKPENRKEDRTMKLKKHRPKKCNNKTKKGKNDKLGGQRRRQIEQISRCICLNSPLDNC